MSHQFGAQLEDSIQAAVIGNTGSHILSGMAADDAEFFHQEYGISGRLFDLQTSPLSRPSQDSSPAHVDKDTVSRIFQTASKEKE